MSSLPTFKMSRDADKKFPPRPLKRVAPVLKKAIDDGSIKLTAIVNTHQ